MSISRIIRLFLLLLAVAAAVVGYLHYPCNEKFSNPISFTYCRGNLYVLEKKDNTVLVFGTPRIGSSPRLVKSVKIEPEDAGFYYMSRELYPGPRGIVVKSNIYDKLTDDFCGFAFREYYFTGQAVPPDEIFRIVLNPPCETIEMNYCCDTKGNSYFVNNMPGRRNIWKLPPGAKASIDRGAESASFTEIGELNTELSNWSGICVGQDGKIYVSDSGEGGIRVYSGDGERLKNFGKQGFGDGELLAPAQIFFLRTAAEGDELLTVANTGNRNWLQFDSGGKVVREISPLKSGYQSPDFLAGRIDPDYSSGVTYAFDLVNSTLIMNRFGLATSTSLANMFSASKNAGNEFTTSDYTVRFGFCAAVCLSAALGFALLSLAWPSIAAAYRWIRIPFFVKLIVIFIPFVAVSTLVVAKLASGIVKADLEDESIRRCANLATAVANSVPFSDLESIRSPEDRGSEAYERIYKTVSSIIDQKNVDQTPKWILHKIRDGRYYFGINIWKGPIFQPFIIAGDKRMFFDVLKEKTCKWGRYKDAEGEWFSYLKPVMDSKGEIAYVLELYRQTKEMDRSEAKVSMRVRNTVMVIVAIALAMMLVFSYLFTMPLRKLINSTRIIGAGNFDHRIQLGTRDELDDLASSFNKMAEQLKKIIGELSDTTVQQRKIQDDLELARKIQQDVILQDFSSISEVPGISLYAEVVPASSMGGDFYDCFMAEKDMLGLLVADVSGKGISAALYMMLVRTLFRWIAPDSSNPADTLSRINMILSKRTDSSDYVSIFYMSIDSSTGAAKYCNAGHHPPLLLRDGKVSKIEAPGPDKGMVAGVVSTFSYHSSRLQLRPGDTVVMYTDGILKARNPGGEMFGEERFHSAVMSAQDVSSRALCAHVMKSLRDFCRGRTPTDDMTILVFNFRRQD